ncbi:MAG TPA: DUF6603 domain-containing protein, partial [Pyrinomonadaceae bacterium]
STEAKTLLTIASSYNKAVAHGFALSLIAQAGGQNYPVTLLPFEGLNQFVPSAAQADKLLGLIAQKLAAAYASNEAKIKRASADLDTLIQSFIAVGRVLGIDDVGSLMAAVAEIKGQPLKWLTERLMAGKAEGTLDAVNNLLSRSLKLPGFTRPTPTQNSNLIQFAPPLPAALSPGSLTITFGTQTRASATLFGMWLQARANNDWLFVNAEAGIGVALPSSTAANEISNPTFDMTLEASIGADLSVLEIPQLSHGPELTLSLDYKGAGAANYQFRLFPLGQPEQHESAATAESFYLSLLPQPEFTIEQAGSGTQPPSHDALTWLRAFASKLLMPLIADTVLASDAASSFLNKAIGGSGANSPNVTPGLILEQWGLLTQTVAQAGPAAFHLADLTKTFSAMTPSAVIENLIFAALSSFPADFHLLSLADKGGIYIISEPNRSGGKDFGLRLQLTDLPLNQATAKNRTTQFLLQLGKWQSADDAARPWLRRANPNWSEEPLGVSFYLLRMEGAGATPAQRNLSLHPKLKLVSVGMDVRAVTNAPLFNMNGVRLNGFEPRIYLALETGQSNVTFGASIQCDGLGLPLGPRFGGSAGNKNPVAQNLLASGGDNDSGSTADAGAKDAINPVFSLSASYLNKFDLQLYGGQPGDPTGAIWFAVQRSFGPLNCRKIGIAWQGEDASPANLLSVLFDGGVSLAGLTIDLDNLSVGIPAATPADYESYALNLGGLDISFAGGPVEISGGLLKTTIAPDTIAYTGTALIKAQKYTLNGAGSYASLEGQPSLFVFASLNTPLGGPAFFFVTGVAAGFGYNRNLILPDPDEVQNFPLVAGSADPSIFQNQDPLKVLSAAIPPRLGSYWLAAGVQFTSFQLVQSSALLVVKFGREFEIALLGLSKLLLPKSSDGANPYVYAELALSVTFKPDTGLLAVSAVLTPNSYVLDRNCQLTGGFAFYIWFSGPHKGDFVVTLGGYHPSFTPPDYYPLEPRLGFNWPISGNITIKGGAYFALTPSCIMAGGSLEATYQSGDLRAWFTAQADFLIAWNPFHYDVHIEISIGASYTLRLIITKTFSVELGASVHLWGPRMQGVVHVHWSVISFSISFGSGDADANQSSTIANWHDFYAYFLDSQTDSAVQAQSLLEASVQTDAQTEVTAATAATVPDVCVARVSDGLVRQFVDTTYGNIWIVRADQLVISTETKIPATQVVFNSGSTPAQKTYWPADPAQIQPVGIRPMEQPTVAAQHAISITNERGMCCNLARDWSWEVDKSGVPAALWDHDASNSQLSPDAKTIPGRLIGIKSGRVNPYQPPAPPPPIDILSAFSFIQLTPRRLPLSSAAGAAVSPPVQDDKSLDVIQNKIMSPLVIASRKDILNSVVKQGYDVELDGRLDILAATAQTAFQSPPMLGSLELGQTSAEAAPGRTIDVARLQHERAARLMAQPEARQAATHPRLRALIRQHAQPRRHSRLKSADGHHQPKTSYSVSGKAHVAGIFATRQDLQSIKGALGAAVSSDGRTSQRMTLHAGATLLWEVESADRMEITLRLDGQLPVRIVTLDRYHNLLADETPEREATDYALPANAAYLSLMAVGLVDDKKRAPACSGWDSSSSLIQVTHKALLGERAVIIPQSANRLPEARRRSRQRRTLTHGLTTGADMVAQNIVKAGRAELRRGWIETLLPSSISVIAVLLRRDEAVANADANDLAASLRVTMPLLVQDGTEQRVEHAVLGAEEFVAREDETCVLFAVPEPQLQATQKYLQARVETEAGWIQEGVIGISGQDVAQVKSGWKKVVLQQSAVSTVDAQDILTEIEMVSTIRA